MERTFIAQAYDAGDPGMDAGCGPYDDACDPGAKMLFLEGILHIMIYSQRPPSRPVSTTTQCIQQSRSTYPPLPPPTLLDVLTY
jgi:hypothetical protein